MVAMLENYVCGVSFTRLLVLVALKMSDMLHLVHMQKHGTGLESFDNFRIDEMSVQNLLLFSCSNISTASLGLEKPAPV